MHAFPLGWRSLCHDCPYHSTSWKQGEALSGAHKQGCLLQEIIIPIWLHFKRLLNMKWKSTGQEKPVDFQYQTRVVKANVLKWPSGLNWSKTAWRAFSISLSLFNSPGASTLCEPFIAFPSIPINSADVTRGKTTITKKRWPWGLNYSVPKSMFLNVELIIF